MVLFVLALFAAAILVRDLWVIPDPTAIPRHFAILGGAWFGILLTIWLVWQINRYGRHWRHYEAVASLVIGASFIACGIAYWLHGSRWYGFVLAILGACQASEPIWKLRKRKSSAVKKEESRRFEPKNGKLEPGEGI
jgi:hypothetical protein